MVGALAIDTYLPSIPEIGREFQVGPLAVQQTLSVFLFTFAFMMLFYGTLSDSFGRRPVILVALVVYTLASLGAVFAPTFGWLLACRALQGLAAGAGSVIGQAIVQDRYAHDQAHAQRIMSHIMMVFGLAPAIAPILGGWLHVTFGWRSTFVFLAAFGALMILLVYRGLPESLPMAQRHAFHGVAIARNYLKVLRNRQFLLLSLAVGLAFGGLSRWRAQQPLRGPGRQFRHGDSEAARDSVCVAVHPDDRRHDARFGLGRQGGGAHCPCKHDVVGFCHHGRGGRHQRGL